MDTADSACSEYAYTGLLGGEHCPRDSCSAIHFFYDGVGKIPSRNFYRVFSICESLKLFSINPNADFAI